MLLLLLVATISHNAMAQDKRLEHNFTAGIGSSKTDNDTDRRGITLSLSYGADIYLSPSVSIMPMIGIRQTSESAIRSGWIGADFNDFSFLDAGLMMRWHSFHGITFGVGPYYSYVLERDKYYIDADPTDPLAGKYKLKKNDFGLMPSVMFDLTRHFSLGIVGHISMIDTSEKYDFAPHLESRTLRSCEAVVTFRY